MIPTKSLLENFCFSLSLSSSCCWNVCDFFCSKQNHLCCHETIVKISPWNLSLSLSLSLLECLWFLCSWKCEYLGCCWFSKQGKKWMKKHGCLDLGLNLAIGFSGIDIFFFSYIFIFITNCSLWGIVGCKARNGWKTWMLNLGLNSAIGFSDIFVFSYIFIFITRYSLWIIEHVDSSLLEEVDEKQFYVKFRVELQNGNWLHCHWNIFLFFIFVTRSVMGFSTCAD